MRFPNQVFEQQSDSFLGSPLYMHLVRIKGRAKTGTKTKTKSRIKRAKNKDENLENKTDWQTAASSS